MATTTPVSTRGLAPEVIRALVNSTPATDRPGEFLVPACSPRTRRILDFKEFVQELPCGATGLTYEGRATRRMLLDIAARYRAGASSCVLAVTYEVCDRTIQRWLEVMGVPLRGHGGRLNRSQRIRIVELYYRDRPSKAALARSFGVTPRAIGWIIAHPPPGAEVPPFPQPESPAR